MMRSGAAYHHQDRKEKRGCDQGWFLGVVVFIIK